MRKAVIVILMFLNVGLLAGLLLSSTPRAQAQAFRGASNYLMLTSKLDSNTDCVLVLDMAKRRLVGWEFDKTRKKMKIMPGGARDIRNDFRKAEN